MTQREYKNIVGDSYVFELPKHLRYQELVLYANVTPKTGSLDMEHIGSYTGNLDGGSVDVSRRRRLMEWEE